MENLKSTTFTKKSKVTYNLLDAIKAPKDIRNFTIDQLNELAEEIRARILEVTSEKGGHLASNLGSADFIIALHYCLDTPHDKILWDVGHQAYPHKLLTGRNKQFDTLRELGGISGFPHSSESEYDLFTTGHSGTSISTGFGIARARDLNGEKFKVVSVLSDASLSAGLAFEGLNQLGHSGTNMVVVLNDNECSISRPVGAMSRYLVKVITNPLYNRAREEGEKFLKKIPRIGAQAFKAVKIFQEGLKGLIVPGILFEELGFRYIGPIDGHDIKEMVTVFKNTFSSNEPVFIHLKTIKGKGYKFSEEDPIGYHGVVPFEIETGKTISKKISIPPAKTPKLKSYTNHFGDKLIEMAEKDKKIVAITAAMKDGTGLTKYAEKFPSRFYDVGIAEAHATTFAAALAKGGIKPVVAIYSTFLQRAYDQLIHDVALQKARVLFCMDRGGIAGKDGATHHGVFDIAYIRSLPNFVGMAPKDGYELEKMMEKAFDFGSPVALRYPRGTANQVVGLSSFEAIKLGKSEKIRDGKVLAIIALGSMVNTALKTADILSKNGIEATVINARFYKPLDYDMLEKIGYTIKKIVTLEEGVVSGGFGSAILEFMAMEKIPGLQIKCLGLPDEFIEHGEQDELLRKYHLTPDEIAETIKQEVL